MTLYDNLRALGWLVRDTFRQSFAYGIFWLLLGVSVISIAVCATITIEGDVVLDQGEGRDFLPRNDPEAQDAEKAQRSGVAIVDGTFSLAFGALSVPMNRDRRDAVHFVELALAGGVADALGLLLALVWTSGFLPGFLDGRSISVLLAKPTPRWLLIVGKYLGVLAFVLFHAVLFVGGTWLALGWRTGVWETTYFWAVPMLLLHFAVFFSFSVLLAVCSRSTVVCVFGSVLFWGLCWSMNFGRHALLAETYHANDAAVASQAVRVVEAGYWFLPKPADLGILLFDALDAASAFGKVAVFDSVQAHGDFHPWLSIAASLSFMAVALVAASRQFAALDY
ncbi:MAG TPA: ABC transporter permease subunit [Pirellulales bacterium]|nr:ABC transporter permease subunit [Pirellulales bacterium]